MIQELEDRKSGYLGYHDSGFIDIALRGTKHTISALSLRLPGNFVSRVQKTILEAYIYHLDILVMSSPIPESFVTQFKHRTASTLQQMSLPIIRPVR